MFKSEIRRSIGAKWLAVCLIGCATIGAAVNEDSQQAATSGRPARTVKLMLHAVPQVEPADATRLTLAPAGTTEADACPLYEKVADMLPSNLDSRKLSDLLGKPLEELPLADVESVLHKCGEAMEQLSRAAVCKSCDWPWVELESMCPSRDQWRYLTFLLALEIHHQLARRQHAPAAETLRLGFATANHLAQGPTVIHGMMGVGVAARMCREIELFLQQPDSPSLRAALEGLPLPFISLDEQMDSEGISSDDSLRRRIELLTHRLDRHIAALRCIEALRLHATSHGGTFPETLGQVADATLPPDSTSGDPFIYRCSGDKAFLEVPAPAGGAPTDATRYELTFKHR